MAFIRAVVLVASAVAGLAATVPRSLPSGTVTCGSNKYSVSELTAAINAGIADMNSGNLPGQFISGLCS